MGRKPRIESLINQLAQGFVAFPAINDELNHALGHFAGHMIFVGFEAEDATGGFVSEHFFTHPIL